MINVLEDAAREAGEILLKFFQKELVVKEKTSQHNVVTEADIAAQNLIKESLLAGALKQGLKESDIGFIGEEEGMNTRAKHTFIIDPLDGTNNFASGLDVFAVIIAHAVDEEVTHGVIYLPVKNELYTAEKEKGAYLTTKEGKKRLAMQPLVLSQTLMAGAISSDQKIRERMDRHVYDRLYPLFRSRRALQCIAYDMSYLVRNIFGASIGDGPRLWDIAASKLLIEEAGGVVVDFEGGELSLNFASPDSAHTFIATHPKNLPAILEALKN